MVEDPGDLLELDDFIVKDPFHNILLRIKDDDSRFFYVHSDYWQYLQYLNIIWGRIKEEYKTILAYHQKSLELTSKYEPSNAQGQDLNNVNIHTLNTLSFIECDTESFILFIRRFLDKVAKLIELLIAIRPPRQIGNSFSDHRKFFIANEMYNPAYSKLLKEETNWYEQNLLIWRDGIFVHGKTLTTGALVSATRGIQLRKALGVYQIREKDKEKFLKIRKKYKDRYPELKLAENRFTMIDEFIQEINTLDILLDKEDLNELKEIVSMTGSTLNILPVAKSVKNFVERAASIFDV